MLDLYGMEKHCEQLVVLVAFPIATISRGTPLDAMRLRYRFAASFIGVGDRFS